MKRVLTFALTALLTTAAWAHNGMEHVLGTIASISATSLQVKTTAGATTAVLLTPDTKWMRGSTPIAEQDAKVGSRVVIHAVKKDGKLVAAEVEIGK